MTDSLPVGIGGVLSALAEPLIDPASRTWWPFLIGAGLFAIGVATWRHGRGGASLRSALGLDLWTTRSSALDLQLVAVRQLLGLLGVLPRLGTAWLLATTLVRLLDRAAGQPAFAPPPPWALQLGYTLVLFVAWDLSRYLLHRLMHGSSILWQFHQVHHSAEVLTPMTFHRVHPVESLLYEGRGVLVTGGLAGLAYWLWRGDAVAATVLGVDAIGFVLNGLTGNLRHSHVWLGFGPRVERWLLSPAQHQLHHGTEREEHGCNYGVWLAVWDRLAGSLRVAGEAPPRRIGLPETVANHRQDLASALLDPFAGAWRRLRAGPRTAALLALVAPAAAVADEAASTPSEEMVVTDAKRKPTVGGAAHEVGEEELERYEQDDIHKVLAHVPGVYVRGEEGFGLRPNIGMRGASSDRSAKVTLLEDGIPLAPAPYAAPAAYYFPLTTRLVGVEVFKGPSAIAHGPQTIGGAVNLQSRRVPDSLSGALDTAVGSFSTLKLHGWGGSKNDLGGFVVEGAHLSSGGYKELDGGGPTGFERQDALAKGRLEFSGDVWRNELELKLGYGRERSNETYLGLSAVDFAENPYRRYAASQRDLMTWQHTQESLSWQLSNGGSFLIRTTAYHNWLDRAWTKVDGFANGLDLHALLLDPDAGQAATYAAILRGEEDSATSDQVLILGTNDREFHNYGAQSVARYWVGNGTVSNLAELGVRLHVDEVSRVRLEAPFQMLSGELVATGATAEKTQDSATEAQALAVYARDTLRVGKLVAVPGVRVETIRTAAGEEGAEPTDPQTRTIVLPGLALSAEPNPWLMTFAGVHRGFSPVAPGSDAATEPETAWNAELGARLNPGSTYAEVAAFGSLYENVHGQCTLSAGCIDRESDRQFNGGEAVVAGVESVLTQELPLPHQTTLAGSLSYTYTWTAFQSDFVSEFPQWGTVSEGDELPYVPAHQGGFELRYETPRVGLAFSGALRGEMRDVAGQGEVPDEELIPASATFDLAGDFRINDRVKLYTVVRNLTNTVTVESLRPYGARPGAPLAVMAGVKVQ